MENKIKRVWLRLKVILFDSNEKLKEIIGGQFPNYNLFNFQYLSTIEHTQYLKKILPTFQGVVLDVGCGNKPYQLFTQAEQYIGVDIIDSVEVDAQMIEGKYVPFADNFFDGVISTQTIEHIEDLDVVMGEIKRVAKPEAIMLISLPFMFQEHGAPFDYRRLTKFGLKSYLEKFGFDVIELEVLGGIGTYIIGGLASWYQFQHGHWFIVLRFLLIPLYIILMPLLNIIGIMANKLDLTHSFYTVVVCLAKNCKNISPEAIEDDLK